MFRPRAVLLVPGIVVTVLVVWPAVGAAGAARATLAAAPLSPTAPEQSSPPLVYHSALYTNGSAPSGSTTPGEIIGGSYRLVAPNYPSSAAPATVRIPSTVVALPTSTGEVHLYFSALNVTLNGSASTTATPGPANRFTMPLTFNATSRSTLTTGGVAVMASWPLGAYALQFRWQWVLEAPDGSMTFGPWSNATAVTPAELADLSFPGGTSWTIGSSKTFCVDGPVAGRTFSAHLSTANPSQVYVTGTATVPAGQSGPYCWTNTLPSGPTAQAAYLHLWEYGNLTYELVVVQVPLVDPSADAASSGGSGLLWIAVIVGAGVVVVAFEVAYMLFPNAVGRVLPQRLRHRTAPTGPPPGADAGADLPPPPPPGDPPGPGR